MKTSRILFSFALLPIAFSFLTCSKKPKPEPIVYIDNSKVSYEITGNYSGKLTVSYMRADGFRQKLSSLGIPWTTSINPKSDVTLVYFTASTTDSDKPGKRGETATAKLYIGGEIYRIFQATADAKGRIMIDSLFYNY